MRNLFDPAAYDIPETGVTFSCDNAALQAVFDDCEQLLKQKGASVAGFELFLVGEGIEKKEENFVDEVMSQIKG